VEPTVLLLDEPLDARRQQVSRAHERRREAGARAGFRWVKTVPVVDEEHPGNTGDEYVMLLRRGAFDGYLASAKTDDPGTT